MTSRTKLLFVFRRRFDRRCWLRSRLTVGFGILLIIVLLVVIGLTVPFLFLVQVLIKGPQVDLLELLLFSLADPETTIVPRNAMFVA